MPDDWDSDGRFGMEVVLCWKDYGPRDLDNCQKSIQDALQPTVFRNDCRVDEVSLYRAVSCSLEGALISVWVIEDGRDMCRQRAQQLRDELRRMGLHG